MKKVIIIMMIFLWQTTSQKSTDLTGVELLPDHP
jgi:hypothetical protein